MRIARLHHGYSTMQSPLARRIAFAANVDIRTLERALRGEHVAGRAGDRVRTALAVAQIFLVEADSQSVGESANTSESEALTHSDQGGLSHGGEL
jgi:hypothetical protein